MNVPLLKLWRKIERGYKRLHRPLLMRKLERINRESNKTILDPGGPVVSLTTFGERIHSVFYTIESIALGQALPSRLTLWMSENEFELTLPDTLKRLKARGLDIQPCKDHGPHKKYLPEVQTYPELELPFITADDDTLYPRYWLKLLTAGYEKMPNSVHCFRAHKVGLENSGKFSTYKGWAQCLSKSPSHLHFSTGDCGVLFPPVMRKVLNHKGEQFTELCPKADDIWLNYHAFKSGIPVTQVVIVPKRFYEVPGTRNGALSAYNNGQGGNDTQLDRTYSPEDRQRLLEIANRDTQRVCDASA